MVNNSAETQSGTQGQEQKSSPIPEATPPEQPQGPGEQSVIDKITDTSDPDLVLKRIAGPTEARSISSNMIIGATRRPDGSFDLSRAGRLLEKEVTAGAAENVRRRLEQANVIANERLDQARKDASDPRVTDRLSRENTNLYYQRQMLDRARNSIIEQRVASAGLQPGSQPERDLRTELGRQISADQVSQFLERDVISSLEGLVGQNPQATTREFNHLNYPDPEIGQGWDQQTRDTVKRELDSQELSAADLLKAAGDLNLKLITEAGNISTAGNVVAEAQTPRAQEVALDETRAQEDALRVKYRECVRGLQSKLKSYGIDLSDLRTSGIFDIEDQFLDFVVNSSSGERNNPIARNPRENANRDWVINGDPSDNRIKVARQQINLAAQNVAIDGLGLQYFDAFKADLNAPKTLEEAVDRDRKIVEKIKGTEKNVGELRKKTVVIMGREFNVIEAEDILNNLG